MITEYITDICKELNIAVPQVSFDTSNFKTDTMLALCDGNTIYLKYDKPIPDQLFSIAHELRHLWQIQTDNHYYFDNYKPVTDLDIEAYNLQPAEIDANAFASIVMVDYFHLRPLYQNMSDKVISAIQDRIAHISNNDI